MAIQIVFRQKSIFPKKINLDPIIEKFKLSIYKENMYKRNKFIIYNKEKIGMGILIERKNKKEISFVISQFVTKTELDDLYKIITFLCKEYNNYELYIAGEYITLGYLEAIKETILNLSLNELKIQCKRTVHVLEKINLLFLDFEVTEEFKDRFGYSNSLDDFENYIHLIQKTLI